MHQDKPTRAATEAFQIIQEAMMSPAPKTLRFGYVDSKGEHTHRHVEPYEIKDGVLFAHDLDKNETRRFKLDSIGGLSAGEFFKPRFPIKIPL